MNSYYTGIFFSCKLTKFIISKSNSNKTVLVFSGENVAHSVRGNVDFLSSEQLIPKGQKISIFVEM